MERFNQPPKPESCLQPGPEPESPGMTAPNDLREAYTGQKRGPQAGFASGLSNSASKWSAADGDGLGRPEPNPDRAVVGEALEGLPGSKRGHAPQKQPGTRETLKGPAALTTQFSRARLSAQGGFKT